MIFDYFFLKLYNGVIKAQMPFPRFGASLVLGGSIVFYFMIINGLSAKIDIIPFVFFNNYTIVISIIIMIVVVSLIYNNIRIEAIKLKFASDEYKPRKRILNVAFVLYLVFIYIFVILVASYKPGYCPTIFD